MATFGLQLPTTTEIHVTDPAQLLLHYLRTHTPSLALLLVHMVGCICALAWSLVETKPYIQLWLVSLFVLILRLLVIIICCRPDPCLISVQILFSLYSFSFILSFLTLVSVVAIAPMLSTTHLC